MEKRRRVEEEGQYRMVTEVTEYDADINENRDQRELAISLSSSNPDMMKRNKRMLGNLMGHLDRAKKNLENDSTILVKQQEIIGDAIQRNQAIAQENFKQEQKMRIQAAANFKVEEIRRLSKAWIKATAPLANFLLTKDSAYDLNSGHIKNRNHIRISWLPAFHTSRTRSLLEARALEVNEMIREREVNDASLCEQIMDEAREEMSKYDAYDETLMTNSAESPLYKNMRR